MRALARIHGFDYSESDPVFIPPELEPKPARKPRIQSTAPLEKEIQADVIRYLRKIGASVTRHNSGVMQEGERFVRFNSSAGHSDLSGVLPGGRAYYFEVKRPGLYASSAQEKFLANRARLGALCGVVHSVEEVQILIAGG
jgi:hypothetical protein